MHKFREYLYSNKYLYLLQNNKDILFLSGSLNEHSYLKCLLHHFQDFTFSPTFGIVRLLKFCTLVSVTLYLFMDLIGIFLVIIEIKHLFMFCFTSYS